MSNPNWSPKKNKVTSAGIAHTRCKIADSVCPRCKEPIRVGATIYRYDNQWVCIGCARPAKVPVVRHVTKPRQPDWEHDTRHVPHSMSYPCDTCDQLPVLRDVDRYQRTR